MNRIAQGNPVWHGDISKSAIMKNAGMIEIDIVKDLVEQLSAYKIK